MTEILIKRLSKKDNKQIVVDEDGNEVDVMETIVPEMFAEEAKVVKDEDKKEINGDTITLVIDLINTLTPSQIYYYNKNIRNVGGIINILSVENKLV